MKGEDEHGVCRRSAVEVDVDSQNGESQKVLEGLTDYVELGSHCAYGYLWFLVNQGFWMPSLASLLPTVYSRATFSQR